MDNIQQAGVTNTSRTFSSAGAWLALAAGIFTIISWGFPRVWFVCFGVAIAGISITILVPKKARRIVLILLTIVLLSIVALPHIIKIKSTPFSVDIILNTHGIQLALERYATDNAGLYPLTITPLRDEGYMPRLPDNPYARRSFRNYVQALTREQQMEVETMQPIGQDYLPVELKSYRSDLTGDFCYLPRIETTPDGSSYVRSYSLLAIGIHRTPSDRYTPAKSIPIVLCYYSSATGEFQDWY